MYETVPYFTRLFSYKNDYVILKTVGLNENKKIKLVLMNNEIRTGPIIEDRTIERKHVQKNSVNDSKLECNISRAKQSIFELSICNEWDYFMTLTLDSNKYNREDLEKYHNDLTQYIRNLRRKYKSNIQFLLVPELHKDGKTWHMHGLIKGIPLEKLEKFKLGDKMGKKIAERVKKGCDVYNWPDYCNKFGFCDLEPIRNPEAISKYITKYINKSLNDTVKELGAHLYYHSRGLNKAEVIKKGSMSLARNIEPDYTNDFCSIKEFKYSDELLEQLINSFDDIRSIS